MKKPIIQMFLALSLISLLPACSEQPINNKNIATETAPIKIEPSESNKSSIDMKKCICVQLWMPVCGENGKTYSNSCFAKCAGVKFKQGSCAKMITD
ncbi:MAG: Kazal-type serine protease inhibitor family protein [Bacteriovorax sp.]|nr:Kazal-type serine protease inhibitor family protein [Bacteriovorax sp.]